MDDKRRDQIRGSLIGGAAGDALGYEIEFMGEGRIRSQYGEKGITEYSLDRNSGKAVVSDDTQMTLFTANGMLLADTRKALGRTDCSLGQCTTLAFLDWLYTQEYSYLGKPGPGKVTWLSDVPELFARRAPGNTCLSALMQRRTYGYENSGYVRKPINNSKGCGGVMRVAPLGMRAYPNMTIGELDYAGAENAAITHGHPLGFLPAAVLVHIVNRIIYPADPEKQLSLKEIVLEARDTISEVFAGTEYLARMTELIDLAVALSENDKTDLDNIHMLGEGWVGEEAVAIAIYCALRYKDDFSAGLIASVNHKGDSDSTGAVTGNILGALTGYEAIEEKWKKDLEMKDVILELADDLCEEVPVDHDSGKPDLAWNRKYVMAQWK